MCWHHDKLYYIRTCLWHDKFWIWQTFWRYDVFYTYWCHDKRFVIVSNFMTSWCVFTFCWHDAFLTPWPAFCRLNIFFSLFLEQNIMKTCFWYNNKLLDVMICFSCQDELFDVMTCFCLHDKLFNIMTYFWLYDTLFDIMTYFLFHDKLMTSWQTFWRQFMFLMPSHTLWRHDELGDVMTDVVTSLRFFLHSMINFVTSWRLVYVMPNFSK